MHAQHQNRYPGKFRLDAPNQVQAAHAGHRQIDDRQIEVFSTQALQGLKAGSGLGDFPFMRDRVEYPLESLPDNGVVVHHQKAKLRLQGRAGGGRRRRDKRWARGFSHCHRSNEGRPVALT